MGTTPALFCFFVGRIFFAGFAKFAQLKANLVELLFILSCVVGDFFTHRTLQLREIILGHKNEMRNDKL